jgi:hypothetical protein
MARFSKLYDDTRGRLARVLSTVRREPTGTRPTTNVRIKLGALPAPLRAVVRDESHGGLLLEAELPWLTVGSDVQTEFPDGREKAGRVHWFGVDATSAGSARLRIFVDLSAADGASPAQLPDLGDLARPPARGWGWPVATVILVVIAAVAGYALAWRPASPAQLASPVPTDATPPRPPQTVAVPKEQPEAPPAAAPSAAPAAEPSASTPDVNAPSPEVKASSTKAPPSRAKPKRKRH